MEAPDRVHVEHIYPQKPQEGKRWPNHSAVLNRIGNLTLLAKRLNTKIKNAEFPEKKDEVYGDSDLVLTKELLEYDEWSTEAIDKRQDELSVWVFDAWQFPGESRPPDLGSSSTAGSEGDSEALGEAALPEVQTVSLTNL